MNHPSPLDAIFFAALEKSSHQGRVDYLDQACAGDPGCRRRIDKMLAAQAQAGSFLESPAAGPGRTTDLPSVAELPGNFPTAGAPSPAREGACALQIMPFRSPRLRRTESPAPAEARLRN